MKKKLYLCSVFGKCCIWVCVAVCLFTGCSRRALHEAQTVVAQADSLWHNGKMYGTETEDSIALAQAYHTLNNHPLSPYTLHLTPYTVHLSSYYVRACYHYGRLLREKDDPVAAMQCFINATHARSRDYHILGRVYSNMGTICELACEYAMSYDMFERSADCFLQGGDTIAYFYALNDMAYESARQCNKKETLSLVDSIVHNCKERRVIAKTWETKAELYNAIAQYDSVIYCINAMQKDGNIEPTGYVLKAQAFDNLENTDSALYYARYVLSNPYASSHDQYNMLYITAHYDPAIDNEEILNQTSQRADIGMIINNQHAKNAQASEILRQNLHQKPYQKPIVIFFTIVIVGVIFVSGIFIYYTRKKKEIQIKTRIEQQKQKRLLYQQGLLMEKNNLLMEQNSKLKEQQDRQYVDRLQQIQKNSEWLSKSNDILKSISKEDYYQIYGLVNRHFFMFVDKLKKTKILTEKEICLCILVLTDSFTDKQMAEILCYSYKTIRSTKRHVALKLGTTSANLQSFLLEKAIE